MKLRTIALITLGLCLTVQAEKLAIPLSLVANGTNYATSAVVTISASETNWVYYEGMYVTVPPKGMASIDAITHVSGTNLTVDTQNVRNMSTNQEVWLMTPRRSVWPSSNPAVTRIPLWGTNTIVRVRPAIYTTNAYDSTKLIYTQAVDMVTTLAKTNSWNIQLLIEQ